ncbi:MAG TPA: DUF6624 domain-containing protein [Mucilaginibacter sp.]|nr:DUF6624 domain-containing protein [Mucilaginibacter sp.]
MKTSLIVTLSGIFLSVSLSAQTVKYNTALIKRIDSMFTDDQFWRKEYTKISKKEKSAYNEETIEKRWEEADSINEVKAKVIINKYGYPGYDLVGESSDNFWAIIQHCDNDVPFQERVLVLMKKQVDKNNASKAKYAYLTDRVLVNKDQKQIYGTQLQRNKKTGKFSPFPLQYPKTVNKLRKEMGLEPLEDYIKNFSQ